MPQPFVRQAFRGFARRVADAIHLIGAAQAPSRPSQGGFSETNLHVGAYSLCSRDETGVAVWRRIPAVVRAVLTGMAVMVARRFPWSILIVVNLRQPHSPPWAVPIMALYLTLYWRYLNGWGWPNQERPNASRQLSRARTAGQRLA